MKKILSFVTAAAMAIPAAVFTPSAVVNADNPCIQTIYSTDPAPMVYNDTVYVYTGRDEDGATNYVMPDWHCYSSTDMQNWTDHGMMLSWDSFSWGNRNTAWASQCIERNGKFYYYVTLECNNGGGRGIGVAVADSPTGPFKDALGKPLCGPSWEYIDPTVFIDDDDQAWLMFGNPSCYYVQLNKDMISTSGQIRKFDMNQSTFGPSKNGSSYIEGPWFYKRNNLYYLVFAAFYGNDGSESIGYSTASSPTGPWKYGGQVMKAGSCYTNHPGVIDYKGHSYLFYHDASLPGGGSFTRSVCVDEFTYGADGSIPTISPTKTGPKQIEALDPYKRVEAETMSFSKGVKTESCSSGGMNIGMIEDGDYVKVSGVDFGSGAEKFTASVSSESNGGNIEMYLDSLSGKKIGTCKVPSTGGWQQWEEVSCDISGASGQHDLYFKFTGGSSYLLNVDWWKFTSDGNQSTVTTTTTVSPVNITTTTSTVTSEPVNGDYIFYSSFENGDDGWEGRLGASVETSSKYAFEGSKSLYCSGRQEAYHGAIISLPSGLSAGQSYSFSANVMYASGSSDTYHFTMQYDLDGDTKYEKIASAKPMQGKWVQLANTNFKIPSGAENVYIYVESENSTGDFYIDEIKIAKAGTVIAGAEGGQFILGDVNSDGRINSLDMIAARKLLVAGSKDAELVKLADVDRSTEYEVNDLVLIQQYILGKVTEFPDNTPEPPPSNFNYSANLQYKAAPDYYFNSCQQQGKVTQESYNGINGQNSLYVYTPYNYDPSKQYNIFYLMHGGGENERTLFFQNDTMIQNMLDHMIMNGELEPMIVVTPTFNKCEAGTFYNEFRQSVVPFVEGKYSTYANKDTSQASIQASRMHRAYGGFSMGSVSTWAVMQNCLDIVGYFMPLSGDHWQGNGSYGKAKSIADAIDKSGLKKNQYFIFAATGTDDIAYPNIGPQIDEMKKMSQFVYTSDFSQGNLYFLVVQGKDHWWGNVRHYVYDGLPYFFHESGK